MDHPPSCRQPTHPLVDRAVKQVHGVPYHSACTSHQSPYPVILHPSTHLSSAPAVRLDYLRAGEGGGQQKVDLQSFV